MELESWIWLCFIYNVIGSTCPYTSKIGSVLGFLSLIAGIVFTVLCFFVAPSWIYGFFPIGISLIVTMLTPKIDVNNIGPIFKIYSGIFSHLLPIIMILMYLSLFDVI